VIQGQLDEIRDDLKVVQNKRATRFTWGASTWTTGRRAVAHSMRSPTGRTKSTRLADQRR
jgi:hypothetical protein